MKLTTILTKLNTQEISTRRLTSIEEVNPRGGQKSFYGKAEQSRLKVGNKEYRILKSYNTYVAISEIGFFDKKYTFMDYSATTTKHIKGFFFSNDIKELRKGRTE